MTDHFYLNERTDEHDFEVIITDADNTLTIHTYMHTLRGALRSVALQVDGTVWTIIDLKAKGRGKAST